MTPHYTIACSPAFGSSVSSSPDMLVNGTKEGNEEVDGEGDIEEDDMYNKDGDFAEDHSINIDMEHEGNFHESDDAMQPSYYHNDQTYPTSGNNQVRCPTEAPDQGAHLQDKDLANARVTDMHQNDHTTSRKGKDQHNNVAHAPK
ncbi:hypothetical protein BDR04DRAFT_1121187 [Suillus decipiens]|nr:hypothetical protein BDR04DRAFT_1121187 [Suillus decipiens]